MASNPYVNKVEYGGNVLIDLTQDTVAANRVLEGYTAHDKSGAVVTGTIPSLGAATYNTGKNDQTIASGQYLSGTQTIRKVTTSNISAANVKYGVTVKVGDVGDDDRILSATGTFSGSTTVSDGQAAAAAGQILSGYSAFVDGAEIKGSIPAKTSSNMTVSGATVTAPAGYYASAASKSVAEGSATTPATTIDVSPAISVSAGGLITASNTGSKSVTPSVSAGYVTAGTAGTVSVTGSNTSQLSTQSGKTVTPSETSQTAVAKGKYTTGAVTVAAIPSDYVGSGIDRRDGDDLTASGATVTAPAGYYAESASRTIASGKVKVEAASYTAAPNITVSATGLVTAQITPVQDVITASVDTAGYVSSRSDITNGSLSVTGSNTKQLDTSSVTQGDTTVSGTTANRGTLTLGAGWENGRTISAAAFGNTATTGTTYVDISNTADAPVLVSGSYLFINKGYVDNLKISLAKLVPDGASANLASNKILSGYSAYDNAGTLIAGSIASKSAQTYTPTTTNQTIAAGKYLSGAQTIKGDANLVASNIRAGTAIFGVTGTHQGTTVTYTETDNEQGGKTVTITTATD